MIALLFGSVGSIRDFTVVCCLVQSYYTPTHSGSGSIMEALSLQKPLVVVINDRLMNNHQTELARQLCKDSHLLYTTHRYSNFHYVDTITEVNCDVLSEYCNINYKSHKA